MIYIFVYRYRYDLLKELAHIITKAEKSQDLQSATWIPKRADGVGPV